MYAASSTPLTAIFQVSPDVPQGFTSGGLASRVAMNSTGDFVVAWAQELQGPVVNPMTTFTISAQRYSAGGTRQGGSKKYCSNAIGTHE